MNYTCIIKNEDQYDMALEEIALLIAKDPKKNTKDADRLELLALLIKGYEDKQYPIDFPTVIEAVRFRMEQEGLKQRDLAAMIGSKGRVSEMLNGKRAFSFSVAKILHKRLGIPAEIFLRDDFKGFAKAA